MLLKTLGLKVTAIKIDPYLNIDAGTSCILNLEEGERGEEGADFDSLGTMSPKEHGECFVLNGGFL